MSVTHIVLFQFKPSADTATINDACSRMLALRDNCLHPSSQRPYIKSSSGGLDNSIEGIQASIFHAFENLDYGCEVPIYRLPNNVLTFRNTAKSGITHAFVVEFANKEDRDYYVKNDPVHQEFVQSLDGIIEKAQVIDFTDRVF